VCVFGFCPGGRARPFYADYADAYDLLITDPVDLGGGRARAPAGGRLAVGRRA
jgi:hypothetical protein